MDPFHFDTGPDPRILFVVKRIRILIRPKFFSSDYTTMTNIENINSNVFYGKKNNQVFVMRYFFYDFWLVYYGQIWIREFKMKRIQTYPGLQHWTFYRQYVSYNRNN